MILPYRETVRGTWILALLVLPGVIGAIAGAIAAARDETVAPGIRVLIVLSMVLVVLVLAFVLVVFTRLRIEVTQIRVSWAFGPFRKAYPVSRVASAQVEPYRWMSFGGWGIRYRFRGGGRAYTVPFSNNGVSIELDRGERYYLSSNDPQRLVEAIEAARDSGGTRR